MHSFLYKKIKLSLLWVTLGNVQVFLLFFKGKQFYYLQCLQQNPTSCDKHMPWDWDCALRNTAFINLFTCKWMFLKGLKTRFLSGTLNFFVGSGRNTCSYNSIIWPTNTHYVNPLTGMFRKIFSFILLPGETKLSPSLIISLFYFESLEVGLDIPE